MRYDDYQRGDVMKTTHQIIFEDSKDMRGLDSASVDLIVTSPPYPMIEMWDEMFVVQNPEIRDALNKEQGAVAFELMHKELDAVWTELHRILKPGGIACINIGDATRTIGGDFVLYQNHSRIMTYLLTIGFSSLPVILWRKQTNAPNKFMGSGMMPPGAYVTLEHEFILIVRNGSMRQFKTDREKQNRRESAFFWEERNVWFSDIWLDLKGTPQQLNHEETRLRSAAYPFELPYRLINMFSVKGDTVLDPFLGTGTTTLAAMAACRNSVGFEIEPSFQNPIISQMDTIAAYSNEHIRNRIKSHIDFVKDRFKTKGALKHRNKHYGFPVVTSQEKELLLNQLVSAAQMGEGVFGVSYSEKPQKEFCSDWDAFIMSNTEGSTPRKQQAKTQANEATRLRRLD
jgi:DNA modification methylase